MYSHWSGKLKPKQILQRQLHTKNMLLLQLFSTTQILKENELSAQGKYHLCEVLHMNREDINMNTQKDLC